MHLANVRTVEIERAAPFIRLGARILEISVGTGRSFKMSRFYTSNMLPGVSRGPNVWQLPSVARAVDLNWSLRKRVGMKGRLS
jgi:hypothetical protein